MDECKVVEVEEVEIPYKLKFTMIEPMKDYDRTKKKEEDKRLIKEWEKEKFYGR